MAGKQARRIAKFVEPLRVEPGSRVDLRDFDPGYKAGMKKRDGVRLLETGVSLLAEYQARLAAQDTYGVLLCLQALDAGGKDGTIRHVMSGVNPQGVHVSSFKVPSVEELDHDYLWRYARRLPARGDIAIFNRSHYEEVLVVRVHPEVLDRQHLPDGTLGTGLWDRRYREINDWERYLTGNGFVVVKIFLNLSKVWLDARQKRIDRQLAIALPTSHLARLPSIRRAQAGSRWLFLHRLANYRAGIAYDWHPAYVLLAGVIAAAAIFYAKTLLGFTILYVSLAAAIVAIMVVRGLFGWQQRRLANQLFRQLPDTIELVTSTVRSGLPVNEAFRTISREMPQPTAGQFAIVCSELSLGRPPEEAVEDVYRRTQVAEYGIFAVTLAVQMKSGGSLTETLQTLGDTVRQRVALAARAKALAGEVIFSSRALSCAPVIVGGLLYCINPQTVDLLFYDPTGRKLLAYAVASVIIGSLVIRWMIRRDTAL